MKIGFSTVFATIFVFSWIFLARGDDFEERSKKFEEIFENVKSQTLVSVKTNYLEKSRLLIKL